MSGRPIVIPPGHVAGDDALAAGRPEPGPTPRSAGVESRLVRASFADATDGYAAVPILRGAGFRIELAATVEGDLVVTIQAARTRVDEVLAVVTAHGGRAEPGPPTA